MHLLTFQHCLLATMFMVGVKAQVCEKKMTIAALLDSTTGISMEDFMQQQTLMVQLLNFLPSQKDSLSMSVRVLYRLCPSDQIFMVTEGFWATSDVKEITKNIETLAYFQAGSSFQWTCALNMLKSAQRLANTPNHRRLNILVVSSGHIDQIEKEATEFQFKREVAKNNSRLSVLLFQDERDSEYPNKSSSKPLMLVFPVEGLKELTKDIGKNLCQAFDGPATGTTVLFHSPSPTGIGKLSSSPPYGLRQTTTAAIPWSADCSLSHACLEESMRSFLVSSSSLVWSANASNPNTVEKEVSSSIQDHRSSTEYVFTFSAPPGNTSQTSYKAVIVTTTGSMFFSPLYTSQENGVTSHGLTTVHFSTEFVSMSSSTSPLLVQPSFSSFSILPTLQLTPSFRLSTPTSIFVTMLSGAVRSDSRILNQSSYLVPGTTEVVVSASGNRSMGTSTMRNTTSAASKDLGHTRTSINLPSKRSNSSIVEGSVSLNEASLPPLRLSVPASTELVTEHLPRYTTGTSNFTSGRASPALKTLAESTYVESIKLLVSSSQITESTSATVMSSPITITPHFSSLPWETLIGRSSDLPGSTDFSMKLSSQLTLATLSKANHSGLVTSLMGQNTTAGTWQTSPIEATRNTEISLQTQRGKTVQTSLIEATGTTDSSMESQLPTESSMTVLPPKETEVYQSTSIPLIQPTRSSKRETSSVYIVPNVEKEVESLLKENITEKKLRNETWTKEFFESAGSVLSKLDTRQTNRTARNETPSDVKVVVFVERVAVQIANTLNVGQSKVIVGPGIVVKIAAVNTSGFSGFEFTGKASFEMLSLPPTLFKNRNVKGRANVAVFSYESLKSMNYTKNTKVSPKTLSAKVGELNLTGLDPPLVYTMKMDKGNTKADCSFWDFDSTQTVYGGWSSAGCSLVHSNATHVTCACDHMTNFAVLLQVSNVEVEQKHIFTLMLMSYIGCGISILGCLLLIAVFTTMSKLLREDRNVIHINLALAIGFANVLFLVADPARKSDIACTSISIGMFYFFLAAFFWMLVEGIHVYLMVVKVFRSPKKLRAYFLIGWVTPMLITVPVGLRLHHLFKTEDFCWVSTEGGAKWAFAGPVAFVLLVNSIILCITLRASYKMALSEDEFGYLRRMARLTLLLMPVFGVTWAFGLLTVNKNLIIFQYLFTAFNSLQGFFIFIFYCVLNSEVRREYQNIRKQATYAATTSTSHSDRFRSKSWATSETNTNNVKLVGWTPIVPNYQQSSGANGFPVAGHRNASPNGFGRDFMLLPSRRFSSDPGEPQELSPVLPYDGNKGGSRTELLYLGPGHDDTSSERSCVSSYKPHATKF